MISDGAVLLFCTTVSLWPQAIVPIHITSPARGSLCHQATRFPPCKCTQQPTRVDRVCVCVCGLLPPCHLLYWSSVLQPSPLHPKQETSSSRSLLSVHLKLGKQPGEWGEVTWSSSSFSNFPTLLKQHWKRGLLPPQTGGELEPCHSMDRPALHLVCDGFLELYRTEEDLAGRKHI